MEFSAQQIIPNLRHLTHSRTGFKGTMLEPSTLEQGCPLDNGRHDDVLDISTSLGKLDALPVELLHMMLVDMDIRTLTTLRRTNRRIRLVIETLREYRNAFTHAPNSIRATLSIKMDAFISCRQLHEQLCSHECVNCGRFGAFFYVLTSSRVCYVCLVENPQFLPITPNHAGVIYGLEPSEIAKLPTAVSIPGRYSQNSVLRRTPQTLIDSTSARLLGIKVHGSVEKMDEYVSTQKAKKITIYEAKLQSSRSNGARKPRQPAYTNVVDGKGRNPYRFMCALRLPWLDRFSGKVEWGLNCSGCCDQFHYETNGTVDWRWLHTLNGYLVHVKQCRESIKILESLA